MHNLAFVKGPIVLHGGYQVFFVGFMGGLLAEVLALYELRHNVTSELPRYLRSPFYWTISAIMACCGGGLTVMYGIDDVQAILALNVGMSAPLLLRTFSNAVPSPKPKID